MRARVTVADKAGFMTRDELTDLLVEHQLIFVQRAFNHDTVSWLCKCSAVGEGDWDDFVANHQARIVWQAFNG